MNFYDRVNELCIKKGMSVTALALELGFSKGTPSNWKTMTQPPRAKNLKKIADFFGVSPEYLLSEPIDDSTEPPVPKNKGVKIPVLGKVQAGIPVEAVEEILDYEEIPESMARHGDYFGLIIRGDSMFPKMVEDDVVIVRKQSNCDSGDIAVILVNGEDATVKKIKKTANGISLIPLNPAFDIVHYSNSEIENLPVSIVGKVVELRRKF